MVWTQAIADALWRSTFAVVFVALAAAVLCRLTARRPQTRHTLWVAVLVWFLAPALLPTKVVHAPWRWFERGGAIANPASLGVRGSVAATGEAVGEPELAADALPDVCEDAAVTATANESVEPTDRATLPGDILRLPLAGEPRVARRPSDHSPVLRGDAVAADEKSSAVVVPAHSVRQRSVGGESIARVRDGESETACTSDSSPHASEDTGALDVPSRLAETPQGDAPPTFAALWSSMIVGIAAWLSLGERMIAVLQGAPPLPASAWLIGAALLLMLHVVSIWRFLHVTRRPILTPPWVQRETDRLARRMGLARSPEVRMVDANISPLVWCGVKPVMYVPVRLWMELGDGGRRAVICHELAHLMRRDHWVCWFEVVVTLLFWWHPVVWWVRRRVHEEADLCCDTWVTWLMPSGRRAYAEALLRTRTYLGDSGGVAPTAGLTATSSGARELSRRITMVMTQRFGPRASALGLGLAAMLMGLGWAVTPALSCPPDEQDAAPQAVPAAPANLHDVYMLQSAPPAPTGGGGLVAPLPPLPPTGGARTMGSPAPAQAGHEEYRTYKLPPEKLEMFWDLMSRDDVGVWVMRGGPGEIQIQGTPEQHEVFRKFIGMIAPRRPGSSGGNDTPNGLSYSSGGGGGRGGAPALAPRAAMPRNSDMRNEMQALRRQQRDLERQAEELRRQAERMSNDAERMREKAERMQGNSGQRSSIVQQIDSIVAQADQLEAQADKLDSESEAVEARADEIEEKMGDADPVEVATATQSADAMAKSLFDATVARDAARGTSGASREELAAMIRAEIAQQIDAALEQNRKANAELNAKLDAALKALTEKR